MKLDKQTEKKFNLAYDCLYDLNSKLYYVFDSALNKIEKEAKKYGYEFKLNERTQKFRLMRLEE